MGFHSVWFTNKATDLFIYLFIFPFSGFPGDGIYSNYGNFSLRGRLITKTFLSQMIAILTCLIN